MSHRKPLKVFFLCWVAYATSQMDLALLGYAIPSILDEWSLTRRELGSILFFSFAGGGAVLVWLGTLTDRLGRKRMLVGSILASSGFVAAHSVVAGPVGLAVLRGAAVATGGLTYPVSGALVTEVAPARWRGIYAGLLQTGYPAGWFLASLFAVPLLAILGWRVLFLVGFVSIPYAWVVHRSLRESQRFVAQQPANRALGSWQRVTMLLRPPYRRRTVTLFCAQFLFVVAYGGTAILFPLYFVEQRGFSNITSAGLVGLGNAVGIVGYFGAAFVGEFVLSRRNTVVVWNMAGVASFLWFVWGTQTYAESLLAFGVMTIFFYGAAAVKFAFVAEVFPTELRATGLAVASSLAVTIGTPTGSVLVLAAVDKWNWDIAFSLFGAVPLFLAGIFYLFLTPVPSGVEVEEVQRHLA